jgi:hypothetical protein
VENEARKLCTKVPYPIIIVQKCVNILYFFLSLKVSEGMRDQMRRGFRGND